MTLKVIVTVDCDFDGYFPFEQKIKFSNSECYNGIAASFALVKETNIPACFLPHTSIYIRKNHNNIFFTNDNYRKLWKKIYDSGCDIGLHPHEESPDGKYYYYAFEKYMNEIIRFHKEELQSRGIIPNAVRFGYFCLTEWTIPVLENNGIHLSFDNMGGYIACVSNHFEEAPLDPYYYSYTDKEMPGDSSVLSIPLGMTETKRLWKGLVPEANDLQEQITLIDELAERASRSENGLTVNLLMHSYNTPSNYDKHKKLIDYIKKKAEFTGCAEILKNRKEQNYEL